MPQTEFDVGDLITSRLKLGITPDGTSVATVVIKRPDGTVITGLNTSAWVGDEKTVQWYATDTGIEGAATGEADGDWLAVWTVTGTGASVSAKVYPVMPLPGTGVRPDWSPFLSDVADYVPYLTVDIVTPGSQTYLGTFTGLTSPTDEQARRHIDDAASIVGAGFSVLATAELKRMARTVTAMYAAVTLGRAFSRDTTLLGTLDALERQAAAALKVLQGAVDDAGAATLSAVPVLYAPQPVAWGDDYL